MTMVEVEVLQADVTSSTSMRSPTPPTHSSSMAAGWPRRSPAPAGPDVQQESDEKAPIGLGDAVATTAGEMPARHVIHAATMEVGGPTSAEIIERATRSTLATADELGCRSLALVAFGTGVGGFPLEQAARLMVGAVQRVISLAR